jgi:hypothetical protein
MPGVHFGDEEEARQTEALASRMIESVADQHMIVGLTVKRISHVDVSWNPNGKTVRDLVIEFTNGFVIRAPQAVYDMRYAPGGFRDALRAENERQAADTPQGGEIRAVGERLASHPGPELDAAGDVIACEPDAVDESAGQAELHKPE